MSTIVQKYGLYLRHEEVNFHGWLFKSLNVFFSCMFKPNFILKQISKISLTKNGFEVYPSFWVLMYLIGVLDFNCFAFGGAGLHSCATLQFLFSQLKSPTRNFTFVGPTVVKKLSRNRVKIHFIYKSVFRNWLWPQMRWKPDMTKMLQLWRCKFSCWASLELLSAPPWQKEKKTTRHKSTLKGEKASTNTPAFEREKSRLLKN